MPECGFHSHTQYRGRPEEVFGLVEPTSQMGILVCRRLHTRLPAWQSAGEILTLLALRNESAISTTPMSNARSIHIADGWFATGDKRNSPIRGLSEDHDLKNELIIRAAPTSPAEIEEVLYQPSGK